MSSNDACTATGVQEPLDERFVNTSYVAQVFSWINVLVLLYVVVVLYFGRFAYSAPFMLHDMRNKEKMKEARAILREKRKRAKQQRKQSERGIGDGGADTELTAAPRPPPATEDVYAGTTAEASMEAASASGVNLRLAHGETSDGGPGAATAAAAPAPAARAPRPSSGPRRVSVGGAEVRVEDLQLEAFVSLERQLVENDNPAVALSYTGFMAAFCLILTGPRTPPLPVEDGEEWLVLSDILLWSAIGLVLLAASAIITDRIVLYKLFARGSLLRGNVVTGIVEGSSFVSCGLIIRAALAGEVDRPFLESLASVALFYALGQVALVISTIVMQVITPYDDQKEAGKGNFAAGVKFAGNSIASAIIISSPILRVDSLLAFGIFYVVGMVLLVFVRWVSNKVLLPLEIGRTVDEEISEDQNYGVAMAEAALSIGIALALSTVLPTLPCPC